MTPKITWHRTPDGQEARDADGNVIAEAERSDRVRSGYYAAWTIRNTGGLFHRYDNKFSTLGELKKAFERRYAARGGAR